MRFNRKLFKEAFKQGYKAAKKLNEATLNGEEIPLNRVPNDVLKKIQSVAFNLTIFGLLFLIFNEKLGYQKMDSINELLDRGLKEDIVTLVSLANKYKIIKNETEARKKFDRFFKDAIEYASYEHSVYWTREWGIDCDDIDWMLQDNRDTLEKMFLYTVL